MIREYGIYLPKRSEARLVTIRKGLRGQLLIMKDIETGVTVCGFTYKDCIHSLESTLDQCGSDANIRGA